MSNTTIALTFVMIVNALMFLSQVAITDINPWEIPFIITTAPSWRNSGGQTKT